LVSYEEKKTKRKVTHIIFSFTENPYKEKPKAKAPSLFSQEDLYSEYEEYMGKEVLINSIKYRISSIEKYHDHIKVNITDADKNMSTYIKLNNIDELKELMKEEVPKKPRRKYNKKVEPKEEVQTHEDPSDVSSRIMAEYNKDNEFGAMDEMDDEKERSWWSNLFGKGK